MGLDRTRWPELMLGLERVTVLEAWAVKEGLRDLYTFWGAPQLARRWLDGLTAECRTGKGPRSRGWPATLVQWREAIPAWHTTGYTNGPVEGLNSLIKNGGVNLVPR